VEKAGFLRRLVAYIIDMVIVGIPNGIIQAIFLGGAQSGDTSGGATVMALIGSVLILVWSLGYLIFFWTRSGQTPGKKIMGVKVVSTDGELIGVGKAILRIIGYAISGIVFYLGFLWIIFDGNKQGWHDKIAGTYVIRV
jgi:uncharacterized RDD family membrane protein YckC